MVDLPISSSASLSSDLSSVPPPACTDRMHACMHARTHAPHARMRTARSTHACTHKLTVGVNLVERPSQIFITAAADQSANRRPEIGEVPPRLDFVARNLGVCCPCSCVGISQDAPTHRTCCACALVQHVHARSVVVGRRSRCLVVY